MSTFEWLVLAGMVLLFIGVGGIASGLEKTNKHLGNISVRLLEIENILRKRS